MTILIKEALIISPGSSNHNKKVDIQIEGGMIVQIKKNIQAKSNYKIIEEPGLCVSAGWFDLQAVSGDPGVEHKEDIDSLIACAVNGGFTAIAIHNFNQPALHNKAQIEYLINKTRNKLVDVFPFGTITVDGKGKDLAELFDMKQSGAMAFSDYKHPISDAGMLMRALQYSSNINSLIITHCNDTSISGAGQMNEGEVSTTLGLKGIPALAEELMLERNISVLEYAGGKMHIPTISTRGSVDLIKKAKSAGLAITCGVAVANLAFDDTVLKDFDTNFKLDPPLRTKKDVQALRNAVDTGIIDVVVSDHMPQDPENKELEFDHAENGMIALQSFFSTANEAMKEKGLDSLIDAITNRPRKILGISPVKVEEGEDANLTLFHPTKSFEFTERVNQSHSKNSPFLNKTLQGKIIGIIKGSKSHFN